MAGTADKEYGRPVRVYVDGIYDLFHFGHARSLKQAKELFPQVYLLVGVCNDELTNKMKGRTVMTAAERYEGVTHCKWADEVVEDAPWVVDQAFLDKHKIDVVAHGEDVCLDENGKDVYDFVKQAGHFKYIKRTEGIATSDLIMRIIRDYDTYVRRNLRKGYTMEDMHVGVLKRSQIKAEDAAHTLQVKAGETVHTLAEKAKEGVHTVVENIEEHISPEAVKVMEDWLATLALALERGTHHPLQPHGAATCKADGTKGHEEHKSTTN